MCDKCGKSTWPHAYTGFIDNKKYRICAECYDEIKYQKLKDDFENQTGFWWATANK